MVSKLWDVDITRAERRKLLHAAHPKGLKFLIRLEVGLLWRALLPSTQLALHDLDWCAILDRDVRPD